MAHNVFIRGLSRAGFRVPKVGGGFARPTRSDAAATQIDLDNDTTAKLLVGERDNYVRVSGSGVTTAVIIGLDRLGFRIKDNGGTVQVVKSGGSAITVDLTDAKTCRVLRRNPGRYVAASTATAVSIYGIRDAQLAFGYAVGAQATATVTSTGVNPTNGDTVVINDKTYRFEATLALANDVKVGANSDATLDNLALAVNLTGVAGTNYFAGTTAPTDVKAAARSGTGAGATVTFTAQTAGLGGNAYASTKTGATLSFGATTFAGGGGSVGNSGQVNVAFIKAGVTASVDTTQAYNRRVLRRYFKAWVEA